MTEANANEGESQAQTAHRIVEEMIVTLQLPPGSRVSEQQLSAQLGIGRTPVREALQRLAYERTIRIQPRSGVVVSDVDVSAQFKLIEVRREIERILVSRSARLASPPVRRKFLELAGRFDVAAEENNEKIFIVSDSAFNRLLAETADNEYASAAMAPMQAQTRRLWYLYFQHYGDVSTVARLHAAISRAVASGKEDKAREASDALIDYVEDYTYKTVEALRQAKKPA